MSKSVFKNLRNAAVFLVIFALLLSCFTNATVSAASTYQPTWASVDQHNPAPEWFQDAKFGIYFHWGAFSVPAYGDEWYPRWMYNTSNNDYSHHVATYGDPFSNWPYQNFINGANDKNGNFTQFAPKLVSSGGNFDPDAWAQLFADAGAKFAGPVAEHHDGFSMWDSQVNEWNSVSKGPKLNLASLFASSIRNKGLKFLMAMHHAYNFNGFYQYAPAQTDPSLQKLYGQLGTTAENQLWYDKLKEIVDEFQPDIIWQDFKLDSVDEQQRLNFLSYYYNKAIDWNKEVVATYKYTEAYNYDDGFNPNGEVRDFERGGPSNLTSYYWLTDDSVSSSSWCYTNGIGYYSTKAMLDALIDRVSKNGNMLLNIAPMADGTIPQGQKDILLGMGSWLNQYGEAIYSTRAWVKFGEGPTPMGGGSFQSPREGTDSDIRFTRNKTNNTLYAIDMGWPSNNQMLITTLNSDAFNTSTITGVSLVGGGALTWSQDSTGLKVNLPTTGQTSNGVAIKITFSGNIPTLYTNAYSQIEAENYSTLSGSVRAETCGEGGKDLGYINTGDYAVYNNVDFGNNGAVKFDARIAGVSTSGKIDVRLDSPTGTLVGTINGVNTGGWQNYTTASCNISGATGKHNVYLVFTAGLNLNWFDFKQVDTSKYYKIVLRNNNSYVLDISNANYANGTNVQISSDAGGTSQQWQFVDAGNGYYEIVSRGNPSYCIDESQTTPANGSNVQIWQYQGNDRQQWKLVDVGGGYYEIQLRNNSSYCIDESQTTPADGSNVQIWQYLGNDRQQWMLVAVP